MGMTLLYVRIYSRFSTTSNYLHTTKIYAFSPCTTDDLTLRLTFVQVQCETTNLPSIFPGGFTTVPRLAVHLSSQPFLSALETLVFLWPHN